MTENITSLKAQIGSLSGQLERQRSDYQDVLKEITVLSSRLCELTGNLPLIVESSDKACAVLTSMSRAMDNKVLAEMLRNLASEFRRHHDFYVPRLEALKSVLNQVDELKGQMTR